MKQNKNIFPSLGIAAALLIATMFASCTKAELEAPVVKQGAEIRFGIEKNGISKPITKSGSKSDSRVLVDYDPNDPCSLGLSMTVVDGIETPKSHLPATKGAQVSQKEQLTAFDVVSYFYANESAEDGSLVFADEVSDGVNTTNKTYYWPSFGEMNFIATYPAGLFGDAGIQTIADDNGHLQSFSYTIPETVADQQDIMIAVTNDVDCTEGAPVPLQFKHLLAAVQFKVGEMSACKVNSIKLTGVYGGTVTYTYNSSTGLWSASEYTGVTEYTPGLGDTSTMDMGSVINDGNQILLLAPQTTPKDAKLIVSWTNLLYGETSDDYNETAEIDISGHTWSMGTTTSYVLNIDTDLNITIPKPDDQDAHYVMVPMYYNISEISSAITDIKASVEYVNNTSTESIVPSLLLGIAGGNSVTDISDCNLLTQRQRQGYWVENRVNGNTITNVRGSSILSLGANKSGTIVMFLPNNIGTTDREVVLRITGLYVSNGVSKQITIGSCSFIQLCPYWTQLGDSYYGSERIEERYGSTDDGLYPYGFSWNRSITYSNSTPVIRVLYSDAIEEFINVSVDDNTKTGTYTTLSGFVTYTVASGWFGLGENYIETITLNYGAISNLTGVADSMNDGLSNTQNLYHFTAGVNVAELEEQLTEYTNTRSPLLSQPILTISKQPSSSASTSNGDEAIYTAIKKNRYNEIETVFEDNGEQVIVYVPELTEDGINWYLPSSQQLEKVSDEGLYILTGSYWSSTSYEDDKKNENAYYCVFGNNGGYSSTGHDSRINEKKVRAVVNWSGAGSPINN